MPVKLKYAFAVATLLLLVQLFCPAQSTRIKGRVTDKGTGEGIPFAGIYFMGSTVGTSSDMDGYYSLETREDVSDTLCATILGYDTGQATVRKGVYQELDFALRLTENDLAASVVKPDNRRVRRILDSLDARRPLNNPEKKRAWQCEIYNKMEIDLTNADEQIRSRLIRKNFGFVFNYMDTSVVSGKPFLPIMISETVSKRYHSEDPQVDREVIEASQISGLENDNMVAQFTGSMHLKINFYDNFINAFNVDIPSPASSSGATFYNYYLIDSLQIDGRKTYTLRFHPKKFISSPVFDGEMNVDAGDYGIQRMKVKLQKTSNVNWIRDLEIEVENARVGDSTWFYKRDNMYVDFSVTKNDSSRVISFIGKRQMSYSTPEFSIPMKREILRAGESVTINGGAGDKDSGYWQNARPYALSQKEMDIYNMVDSIKNVPLYRDLYSIVETLILGYYGHGKLSYGPVYKFVSFNNLEGTRMQFGVRTTAEFSKKLRITAYGAYGTKDKEFKGGGTLEYMLSRTPTRKLTVTGKRDMLQLGKGTGAFSESNFFSSILTKSGGNKMSPVNEWSAEYAHEWSPGFNMKAGIEARRIFSNSFVPMVRPDGTNVNSVGCNQGHLQLRFSWNETVTRGVFVKSYLYSKYPILTFDLIGSLKGIGKNEYSFGRTEISMDYRLPMPPAGVSKIKFNAGHIIGRVPYPLLKLHEGNGSYLLDKSAFACMEYYEFASDTWASLFWSHNFGGFFLGKIPGLRRLNLREVISLNMAYGTLSEKNNGIIGDPDSQNVALLFPEGMNSLNKPYVEMGAGITNILKLFRVDTFWRLTHRYRDTPEGRIKSNSTFAVNFGIEVQF